MEKSEFYFSFVDYSYLTPLCHLTKLFSDLSDMSDCQHLVEDLIQITNNNKDLMRTAT